ncbi:filaggrin [Triplophysa rosa]|uniref:filaggrin n=1 Tax=Triplophysa rosa TaxID=992332 RepID=UPI00254615B0|nr:filaggrin [Triplophysa rosa]
MDIPRERKAFEDDEDEVDSMPLLESDGHLQKSTGMDKNLAGKEKSGGSARKAKHSHQQCEKGVQKQQNRVKGRVMAANIRKTKSMEVLSRQTDHSGVGALNEQEVEKKKKEAHTNFMKEKMKFSAFLNEITRQVLSPSRLTSLGVTNVHRPSSSGQTSGKSPKPENKQDRKSKSTTSRRGSGASSVTSTAHSHISKHSHSSKRSHSHKHSHCRRPSHSSKTSRSHKRSHSAKDFVIEQQHQAVPKLDQNSATSNSASSRSLSSGTEQVHMSQKKKHITPSEQHFHSSAHRHSHHARLPSHHFCNEDSHSPPSRPCSPESENAHHHFHSESHQQHTHHESHHHHSPSSHRHHGTFRSPSPPHHSLHSDSHQHSTPPSNHHHGTYRSPSPPHHSLHSDSHQHSPLLSHHHRGGHCSSSPHHHSLHSDSHQHSTPPSHHHHGTHRSPSPHHHSLHSDSHQHSTPPSHHHHGTHRSPSPNHHPGTHHHPSHSDSSHHHHHRDHNTSHPHHHFTHSETSHPESHQNFSPPPSPNQCEKHGIRSHHSSHSETHHHQSCIKQYHYHSDSESSHPTPSQHYQFHNENSHLHHSHPESSHNHSFNLDYHHHTSLSEQQHHHFHNNSHSETRQLSESHDPTPDYHLSQTDTYHHRHHHHKSESYPKSYANTQTPHNKEIHCILHPDSQDHSPSHSKGHSHPHQTHAESHHNSDPQSHHKNNSDHPESYHCHHHSHFEPRQHNDHEPLESNHFHSEFHDDHCVESGHHHLHKPQDTHHHCPSDFHHHLNSESNLSHRHSPNQHCDNDDPDTHSQFSHSVHHSDSELNHCHSHFKEENHNNDHPTPLRHSPVGQRSTSPHSNESDSSDSSIPHGDPSTVNFQGSSSFPKKKDSELERLMMLQEQNEVLHHSLLKTTMKMECMGAEFKTGHQLLEYELQRTRIELTSLMDRFTRLQDNCSCTQQTNHLLENKLHCVAQSMDGERERLNQRLSELTEQLSAAKTTIQSLETINVTSMLQDALVKHLKSDAPITPLPAAHPPAQFMDNDHYEKISMTADDQTLGTLPEEEESDWSEMGEEAQNNLPRGSHGIHENASYMQWEQRQSCWEGTHQYEKGNGDTDSESGGEDNKDHNPSHPLRIPHLKFTVHPETLPVPVADVSLARFKQSPDGPASEVYQIVDVCNLGSPIRVLSASLEEIHSIGLLKQQHQEDHHGQLRSNKSLMDLHQSQFFGGVRTNFVCFFRFTRLLVINPPDGRKLAPPIDLLYCQPRYATRRRPNTVSLPRRPRLPVFLVCSGIALLTSELLALLLLLSPQQDRSHLPSRGACAPLASGGCNVSQRELFSEA